MSSAENETAENPKQTCTLYNWNIVHNPHGVCPGVMEVIDAKD